MVAFRGVTQGKKETLHTYINRFTKVDVVVKEIDESLKRWIFQKGLLLDNIFWENLVRKEAHGLNALLSRPQPYVKYEEKLLANGGGRRLNILGYRRTTYKDSEKSS